MINRFGKPVDKTRWSMTPPTINAYYNATDNEIVFPAGILQFPFFDFEADDALNYGGVAAVIGHEMTHGFDDRGVSIQLMVILKIGGRKMMPQNLIKRQMRLLNNIMHLPFWIRFM
jgi:Peptidase family M13